MPLIADVLEHPMVTEAKKRGFVPGAVHNGAFRTGFYVIFKDDEEPHYNEKFDQIIMSDVAIYWRGKWAQIWNKELQIFETV